MAAKELKPWEIEIPAGHKEAIRHDIRLGADFFAAAAHADLVGGNITAHVELEPLGNNWRLNLRCEGEVETTCDRCLGAMTTPVSDSYQAPMLPSPGGQTPAGDDSEAVYYDPATGIADLLRPLADTLALSLGLCHIHPEGECDPEIESALDHRDLESNTPLADALKNFNPDDQEPK